MTAKKTPKGNAIVQNSNSNVEKVIDIYLTPGKQKNQTNQIPTFISLFLKTG